MNLSVVSIVSVVLGQVVLRGSDSPDPRPIVSLDAAGARLGEPAPELVGWERVKNVLGERRAGVSEFLRTGEAAWRAQSRLARGDYVLAEPVLIELAARTVDARSSTALIAREGLAWCYLTRGELGGAGGEWLAALALRRAGVSAPSVPGPLIDPETGLAPLLPPMVFGPAHARALIESLDRLDAMTDPLGAHFEAEYRRAAEFELGSPVGPPPAPIDEDGARLVSLVVQSRIGDEGERESARQALAKLIASNNGTWREAWARAAVGRSLLREQDESRREAGIVEIIHLPARFASTLPGLAAGCMGNAASVLTEMKRPDEARVLQEQARLLAERGAAGAWSSAAMAQSKAEEPGLDPRDAAVEQYLTALGLDRLLSVELESRMEGPGRVAVASRLADVYVRLLALERDATRAKRLEARALELLALAPDADTIEARLALCRSAYARAERTAELFRLRLAEPDHAGAARAALLEIEPRLATAAAAGNRRVDELSQQEELGRGENEADLLAGALEHARRIRGMAQYLAAWSAYYVAELDPAGGASQIGAAGDALRAFGPLLNARAGALPNVERAPVSMIRYDHVARSVIGAALCHSLRGETDEAVAWLNVLDEVEYVPPEVADQKTAWRLVVLARGGRWRELQGRVSATPGGPFELPLTVARLASVLALEATPADQEQEAAALWVAQAGLAALVAQGEQDQARDLAARYAARLEEMPATTFVPSLMRGLREFERARIRAEETGSPRHQPADDEAARRGFSAAAEFLRTAVQASDADRFGHAVGVALGMRAQAVYYAATDADQLAAASDMLAHSARTWPRLAEPAAGDLMHLAMRAMSEAAARAPAPARAALERRRDALIDQFLDGYSDHPGAGLLLLERAAAGGVPSDRAVDMLMRVPESSPIYGAARRRAAGMLYDIWRGAPQDRREGAATKYLALAVPLFDTDRAQAIEGTGDTGNSLVAARRLLDCMLAQRDPDPFRAQRVLDFIEQMAATARSTDRGLDGEILFRSAQVALLHEDFAGAESALERLKESGAALASAGERVLYNTAARHWRASGAMEAPARIEAARRVVRYGAPIIAAMADDPTILEEPGVLNLHAAVAEAAGSLWVGAKDQNARDLAALLYRVLLRARPRSAPLLRQAALFYDAAGDTEAALTAWRSLLAGLSPPSDDWFEAKCAVLEHLIEQDPARAKEVFEQHRLLYPDLGPGEWGERLRAIGARLAKPGAQRP